MSSKGLDILAKVTRLVNMGTIWGNLFWIGLALLGLFLLATGIVYWLRNIFGRSMWIQVSIFRDYVTENQKLRHDLAVLQKNYDAVKRELDGWKKYTSGPLSESYLAASVTL